VKTLADVFPALDLYATGLGEVIAVAAATATDRDTLAARAAVLQERHRFRYPLPPMLRRLVKPPADAAKADLITDDFAPADVYDVMGDRVRRKK
jgi:hypothetical protein